MMKNTVKEFYFTPFVYFKGQESFYKLSIYIFIILTLSGCIASNQSEPLALKPPAVSAQYTKQSSFKSVYLADPLLGGTHDIVSSFNGLDDGSIESSEVAPNVSNGIKTALINSGNKKTKKCRIKDRFDRKAVLAYEWGYKRIALDVDGINLGGGSKGIKLEYKMNLQRKKNRAQKCRYKSNWQGLIGSGYHEFFVKENDTIWGELRSIKNKVTSYMDETF